MAIKVKAAPSVGNRVALWEINEAHPEGEVYIAGSSKVEDGRRQNKTYEVAETPLVLRALSDGKLVRVSGGSSTAKSAAEDGEEQAGDDDEGPEVAEARRPSLGALRAKNKVAGPQAQKADYATPSFQPIRRSGRPQQQGPTATATEQTDPGTGGNAEEPENPAASAEKAGGRLLPDKG